MNCGEPTQLVRRNPDPISLYRKRVRQRVTGDCGESAGSVHICVVHLITVVHVHVTVGKVIVVDVGDIRNIDVRVGDIDAVKVSAAYPIPRDEWFTKTKRAPSQASAETESDPTSPAAAKPGDQRGGVVGTNVKRAGSPSPKSTGINPAAIVEGSKSPRLVINPSPAPRIFPDPVTVCVWRPASVDTRGPHRPVFGCVAPGSILVKIISPNRVR